MNIDQMDETTLDTLIAENIMGWHRIPYRQYNGFYWADKDDKIVVGNSFSPCSDEAFDEDSLLVFEKALADGWNISFHPEKGGVVVEVFKNIHHTICTTAAFFPLALCRSLLKAFYLYREIEGKP